MEKLAHLKTNLACWFALMVLAGMISTWADEFFHLAPLSPRSVCADTCRGELLPGWCGKVLSLLSEICD